VAVTGRGGIEQASHLGHSDECTDSTRQRNDKSAADRPSDLGPALTNFSLPSASRAYTFESGFVPAESVNRVEVVPPVPAN
jgi:hypothetical protein